MLIKYYGTKYNPPPDMPKYVFPGSFNPFHEGHRKIHQDIMTRTSHNCYFEMSTINMDKERISVEEIERRFQEASNDMWGYGLFITDCDSFYSKSVTLPNSTFIIGADTYSRLLNTKYYNDSEWELNYYLKRIFDNGCNFVVYPRTNSVSFILNPPPKEFEQNFRFAIDFEPVDISSTQIRNNIQ